VVNRIAHVTIRAIVFPISILNSGCCDRVVQQEERSPSGNKVATVTVENCGALSDYATGVNLKDLKAPFWKAKTHLVVGIEGRHSVIVLWKDDQTLIVQLPESALQQDHVYPKIVNQNDDVNGVHIEYRPEHRPF
jgi:hypothetical protein